MFSVDESNIISGIYAALSNVERQLSVFVDTDLTVHNYQNRGFKLSPFSVNFPCKNDTRTKKFLCLEKSMS